MDAPVSADQQVTKSTQTRSQSRSLADFAEIGRVFAIDGEAMMLHVGRSVVRLNVDGHTHFLKRFWFTPLQALRRFCAQGLHELAMIDWLNANGFLGPDVVARGVGRRLGMRTRVFFLMREADDELPLERFARRNPETIDSVIDALALHTARLHDAGFYHTDYSERHIHVARLDEGFRFRQIDLERARVASRQEALAAADIKTLMCSIANERLANLIEGRFVERYLATRSKGPTEKEFRALLSRARATKTFE